LKELERLGSIVHRSLGPTIEATLDYRRNPDAGFLAYDLEPTATTKTEVITAASYTPVPISVPYVWTKMEEVMNPTENQKIALVKSKATNAVESHDELIEEAIFATSTQGFLGLATIIPTTGQGTVGGIDASLETWWRNSADTYEADGSDIEAVFTEVWNNASKGSGATLSPKGMVSGSEPHALYESQLTPLIRYQDLGTGDSGFKVLAFKTARYVFSQFGGTKVYFHNPKSLNIVVSKQYFRDLGPTINLQNGEGFKRSIFSALQTVTDNKSRLAVVDEA